jgi:hypothetical protein
MAHYGFDAASEFPADEAAAPERGMWSTVKDICLFPFRLAGLLLAVGLLIGSFGMWIIPDLAARHEVDMLPLVLRVLDDENSVRPFRLLGYQPAIHGKLLDLQPPRAESEKSRSSKDPIVSAKPTRVAGGYAYEVRFASGKSKKLTATTPHTTVPPEELAAARKAVLRAFP